MSTVLIVDHGLCNIGSIRRAFEECGASVRVEAEPVDVADASHIVLPGVGSFARGMDRLNAGGWDSAIKSAVAGGARVLGVCLGMQLLAEHGTEGGETRGLGLVPGRVERMEARASERIPHVGWNDVRLEGESPLFREVPSGTDFYFVHSFRFLPGEGARILASVDYAGGVAAAVERGNVFGVQFHPEKSSKAGFRLIRNFLEKC